jgi:hypothetical protein
MVFTKFKVKTKNGPLVFFNIRPIVRNRIVKVDNFQFSLDDVLDVKLHSKRDVFVNLVDVPPVQPDGQKLKNFVDALAFESGDYL